MECRYSNRALFVYAGPLGFSLINPYRRLSSVVRAQEGGRQIPPTGSQPLLNRNRETFDCRGLREGVGKNWTVTAYGARDVESGWLGFAMATVRTDDDRIRIVDIRMEPCNGQVAPLMSGFRSRTRLVTTRRAGAWHSHVHNRIHRNVPGRLRCGGRS